MLVVTRTFRETTTVMDGQVTAGTHVGAIATSAARITSTARALEIRVAPQLGLLDR